MKIKKYGRKDFSTYYKKSTLSSFCRWVDWRKKVYLKKYLKNVPQRGVILEIGPGTGRILSSFIKKYSIVGMESNKNLLEECKKKGFLPVLGNADFLLPFKPESFLAVITIDSIEHLRFRNRFAEEVYRVLKPKGIFINFTPPYDSALWVFMEKLHNLVLRTKTDHISPFTKESMFYLLSQNFKNIKIKKINFSLTMLAVGEKKQNTCRKSKNNKNLPIIL